MKRLILFLGIVVVFVFSLSVSNVLAQFTDQCEGDYNIDQNQDANDVTKFLEDFGRNQFSNPCPEPPFDNPPYMTRYERMFCGTSDDCWLAGYERVPDDTELVCCCWDVTFQFNYGCRGWTYCMEVLHGMCEPPF